MEGSFSQAHKSLMKVVDNLPSGEVKDEYNKFMTLIMRKIQAPDARSSGEGEGEIAPFPV